MGFFLFESRNSTLQTGFDIQFPAYIVRSERLISTARSWAVFETDADNNLSPGDSVVVYEVNATSGEIFFETFEAGNYVGATDLTGDGLIDGVIFEMGLQEEFFTNLSPFIDFTPFSQSVVAAAQVLNLNVGNLPLPQQNTPPIASNDFFEAVYGEETAFNVTLNDSDPDSDKFLVSDVFVSNGVRATFTDFGDIFYTSAPGFLGIDTLTYNIVDENGGVSTGFVEINVVPNPNVGIGLTEAEARTVAYIYEAGLDLDGNIDLPGLNYWIDQREAGLSERALSLEFLRSDEFETSFGDPLDPSDPGYLDDFAFVTALYENVLDRAADDGGRDYWLGVLDRPAVDRADLLLAFAESPENVNGSPQVETLTEVTPGEWAFV